MHGDNRKKEIKKAALTRAFNDRFRSKLGMMPNGGAAAFLESPGKRKADKRDGILALKRENSDQISSLGKGDPRRQQLYEARDQIDQYALYNYFKDTEDIQQLNDPDDTVGPFRRRFYASRYADVNEQLSHAE